jgi:ribosomal protein L11 methyltransferase
MFVWRKRAGAGWLAANELTLREIAGPRLAIVFKPANRNAIAQVASSNCFELKKIQKRFGGTIEKLPRNWLQKFLSGQKSEPLKIGKRLLVTRKGSLQTGGYQKSAAAKPPLLVIPVAAAFGTGEHVTTAMPLRMLERLTRKSVTRGARHGIRGPGRTGVWVRSSDKEFSLLDLGTGSGILALAAARFGAKRIIAIDQDPVAMATAKKNARRNKIEHINFLVADVRRWKFPASIDIITANLFSELLIEILPKLKCAQWLILSGVLREQEPRLVLALQQNGIVVTETRRRGKWVALLAGHPERQSRDPVGGRFKVTQQDPSTALGMTKQGKNI